MANPFPGMDPYLESAAHWRGFHELFIAEMWRVLSRILPSGFVARPEPRFFLPEVLSTRRGLQVTSTAPVGVIDKSVVYTMCPGEMNESFLQVLAISKEPRVVTVIELLSPASKNRGREEYVKQRGEVLRSDVNLMEIDLFRGGEQTVLIPRLQQPGSEYLVSLHRGDGRWDFETWAFGLHDRMPRVGVPLTDGLPDIPLDLQAILNDIHDLGKYDETLDYAGNPEPTFSPADSEWADNLLRAAGYRSTSSAGGSNGTTV